MLGTGKRSRWASSMRASAARVSARAVCSAGLLSRSASASIGGVGRSA
jgi:hypothetical protein